MRTWVLAGVLFGAVVYGAIVYGFVQGGYVGRVSSPLIPDPQAAQYRVFEKKYRAWVAARREWRRNNRLSSLRWPELPEEQALLEMGVPIVPLLVEELEREVAHPVRPERAHDYTALLGGVTGKHVSLTPGETYDAYSVAKHYIEWWKTGRDDAPKEFAAAYARWDKLTAEGKDREAEMVWREIRSMGIEIIPLVIERIEAGDKRVLEWPQKLVPPKVRHVYGTPPQPPPPTADSVLKWWENNKAKYTLPPTE